MIEAAYLLTGTFILAVFWMARSLVSARPVSIYIHKSRIGGWYDTTAEFFQVLAGISGVLIVVTSLLAMELSLTISQILQP